MNLEEGGDRDIEVEQSIPMEEELFCPFFIHTHTSSQSEAQSLLLLNVPLLDFFCSSTSLYLYLLPLYFHWPDLLDLSPP